MKSNHRPGSKGYRRERIAALALDLVMSQVAAGQLDHDDKDAFEAATKAAIVTARKACDSADEFLS